MNDFYDETAVPELEPEFEPAYNRHYITADAQGRITDYWSDGPHPNRNATNAICINDQGGYQFDSLPGGEINPSIYTEDGIPLYRWDGEQVAPARRRDRGRPRPSAGDGAGRQAGRAVRRLQCSHHRRV